MTTPTKSEMIDPYEQNRIIMESMFSVRDFTEIATSSPRNDKNKKVSKDILDHRIEILVDIVDALIKRIEFKEGIKLRVLPVGFSSSPRYELIEITPE